MVKEASKEQLKIRKDSDEDKKWIYEMKDIIDHDKKYNLFIHKEENNYETPPDIILQALRVCFTRYQRWIYNDGQYT